MAQQFKNMNDLVEYLGTLEERIKTLEAENSTLPAIQPKSEIDGNMIARVVSRYIPQTGLISPSFLKRSFTVWGHFFVANLIIGTIFGIIYACLMMVMFGSIFGNLIQQGQ